jgi:hypothetical protein
MTDGEDRSLRTSAHARMMRPCSVGAGWVSCVGARRCVLCALAHTRDGGHGGATGSLRISTITVEGESHSQNPVYTAVYAVTGVTWGWGCFCFESQYL